MSYTNLNHININNNTSFSLEELALNFINNRCEDLRYLENIEEKEKIEGYKGTSLKKNQIPFRMFYSESMSAKNYMTCINTLI